MSAGEQLPPLPDLDAVTDNVRLGATVDAYLEEIGEFRPGEAWGDCADRVAACQPALAGWLHRADARWEAIAQAEGDQGAGGTPRPQSG